MNSTNEPLISVITPSYNQGTFLEATIKSVLEQNYSSLELIVIDGGSNDGSVDIIQKYAQKLAYWVSEPDLGQADAIQKGINLSSGNIIAYLNSDDLYCPNALRTVSEIFSKDPSISLVYGTSEIIDAAGNQVGLKHAKQGDFINYFVQLINPIPQSSTFITREAYTSVGGINPGYHMIMDYDLWARIWFWGGKFAPTNTTLSKFRIHLESKTYLSSLLFAEECMKMVNSYLDDSELGKKISHLRNQLYGSAHLRFANAYHISGKKKQARSHYRKLIQYAPRLILTRRGINLTIRMFLGIRSFRGRLADRATKNFS